MRSSFTDTELADYRSNGFLSVPDFLSPTELQQWREIVTSTVEQISLPRTGKNSEKAFTQRMHLRRRGGDVQALVETEQIGKLVAQLEGIDGVRLYLDQALVKEPYGAPTQYHLDIPWWGFDSHHACTIWIALDDSTTENGCLYFVPGSHEQRLPSVVDLGPDLGAVFAAHPEAVRPSVACPLPAGGASFHNGHTIHGAGANMTHGRRRAMTMAFMPQDARYNGVRDAQVLGDDYLDRLEVGQPLENDDLNPLIYSRG